MLYYNEFYISMILSPSLYFIYAYFISLIYDLKKCLYFFLQKVTVLGIIFLCSLFCESMFTDSCLYLCQSCVPLPSSLFSLSVYPQLLLFFDYWTISWYEFASRCNFDFMSYASICSLLNNLNICNYDFLFVDDYLKCETRAPSKLTSALFGLCVVLHAFPSNVIIFYCGQRMRT